MEEAWLFNPIDQLVPAVENNHGVGWSANQGHLHYAWLKPKGPVAAFWFRVSKPRLNGLDIRRPQTAQLSSGQSYASNPLRPYIFCLVLTNIVAGV